MRIELGEDVADVIAHGVSGDEELGSDGRRRSSDGKQSQNVNLPGGEPLASARWLCA